MLVLLASDAGTGHFSPILHLAKALKERQHRVVICSFDQRKRDVQAAGIGFVSAGSYNTEWHDIPGSDVRSKRIVEV